MPGKSIGGGGPRNLPLSMAYRAGDLVFVSGQVGFADNGKLIDGGITIETRQTLKNIQSALEQAGATLSDVAKITVFLADLNEFDAFNAVYREFFPEHAPARTTVGASLMVGARVEIDAIARLPR